MYGHLHKYYLAYVTFLRRCGTANSPVDITPSLTLLPFVSFESLRLEAGQNDGASQA